ncbi:GNAT family N-acetyltransferase [Paenibacillus sediminis]|uniref:GNAT superfamily N-acetyltransferase n=1 Tax=Paenibacillus sediminis TaxID=664909 RepID=A0ABS4H216_9BACL|nr:GNAT family N-acetyltransferase [Paenibacillus sediminis]MBP1936521.1 GNAT superfamily N-acetyltransferase [Paenibacillus sediminis]
MKRIRELQEAEEKPLDLWLLADPELQVVQSYMDRSLCYVLELDGSAVGQYLLLPTRPMTVELVNVAVAESMHGRGYGKELVQHAVETAKRLGYHTIEVGTGNSSIGQLALYQKCGFRICGVDQDFFIRHYSEPIYENGIQCRDMIRLQQDLTSYTCEKGERK